ncbi:hypothetical protein GCM10025872_13070 [Barrientosiimonas endolithica]|uniref:Alpha/beta hydrolase n=1 Tax=Barrientosiimonas endolithica TaxID=1535208 RepID=A0ABN6YNS7_9MICO|nr:hypothetical protein GCM10025872_13070 [Barrientosiimonas endolithica]
MRELADALGLERFANVGESGGGPHALVLAYALGDRLTLNLVLAGMGPAHEAWVRDGMKPMNRVIFGAAQRAPWLLRPMMAAMGRAVRDDKRYAKFVEQQLKVSPPPDRGCSAGTEICCAPVRLALFGRERAVPCRSCG